MADEAFREARGRSGDLHRLAGEFGISEDQLGLLYEADLSELEAAARIRMFLPILVMRRLERVLRRRNAGGRNLSAERVSAVSRA